MSRDVAYLGQSYTGIIPYNPYLSYTPSSDPNAAPNNYAYYMGQSVPASQTRYGKRKMLKWLVPEQGIVEMYINPQSIGITHGKNIKSDRTKGGFVVQYWGDELININITGHTGSSGIEGINVLYQVFKAEQTAFDIIALQQQAKDDNDDLTGMLDMVLPGVSGALNVLSNIGKTDAVRNSTITIPYPSLGYYACSMEMYWQGEIYRGFFDNMTINESADKLGIFDYTISFKATQKRGIRRNQYPWQKSAISGPSGVTVPYTFGSTPPLYPKSSDPRLTQAVGTALTRQNSFNEANQLLNR